MIGSPYQTQLVAGPAPLPGFFVEMLKHMQHYDCDVLAWFKQNGYLSA